MGGAGSIHNPESFHVGSWQWDDDTKDPFKAKGFERLTVDVQALPNTEEAAVHGVGWKVPPDSRPGVSRAERLRTKDAGVTQETALCELDESECCKPLSRVNHAPSMQSFKLSSAG